MGTNLKGALKKVAKTAEVVVLGAGGVDAQYTDMYKNNYLWRGINYIHKNYCNRKTEDMAKRVGIIEQKKKGYSEEDLKKYT